VIYVRIGRTTLGRVSPSSDIVASVGPSKFDALSGT